MAKSNKQLEELRSYVIQMITNEQDEHSKLLEDISFRVGVDSYTNEQHTEHKLKLVHYSRVETLEKILEKIKELQ